MVDDVTHAVFVAMRCQFYVAICGTLSPEKVPAAAPTERRAFLRRHYHFDIDAAAPPPPPPPWRGEAAGGAVCEWRPAAPPGPLDHVDRHLTALRSPGAAPATRCVAGVRLAAACTCSLSGADAGWCAL